VKFTSAGFVIPNREDEEGSLKVSFRLPISQKLARSRLRI